MRRRRAPTKCLSVAGPVPRAGTNRLRAAWGPQHVPWRRTPLPRDFDTCMHFCCLKANSNGAPQLLRRSASGGRASRAAPARGPPCASRPRPENEKHCTRASRISTRLARGRLSLASGRASRFTSMAARCRADIPPPASRAGPLSPIHALDSGRGASPPPVAPRAQPLAICTPRRRRSTPRPLFSPRPRLPPRPRPLCVGACRCRRRGWLSVVDASPAAPVCPRRAALTQTLLAVKPRAPTARFKPPWKLEGPPRRCPLCAFRANVRAWACLKDNVHSTHLTPTPKPSSLFLMQMFTESNRRHHKLDKGWRRGAWGAGRRTQSAAFSAAAWRQPSAGPRRYSGRVAPGC
jgi:hypothetical protein